MAIFRAKDIRQMNKEERQKNMNELHQRLLKHRARVSSGGTLDSPGEIHEIRRTIARILTIEHELERAKELAPQTKSKE